MDEDEDGVKKHRRTYGKGYIDALQAVGLSAEEAVAVMNNTKMQAIVLGQTSIARKVLEIVPYDESWPATMIIAELRKKGHNMDFHILEGCLASLKAAKLIKEDKNGWYRPPFKSNVTLVKAADPPGEPAKMTSPPAPPMPAPSNDVLTRVGALAEELRTIAAKLEDLALEVENKAQQVNKDSEKLKKLRAFLEEEQ